MNINPRDMLIAKTVRMFRRIVGWKADRMAVLAIGKRMWPLHSYGANIRAQGPHTDTKIGTELVVQCHAGKSPSVWRALNEAEDASLKGELAVAVVERVRIPNKRARRTIVVMEPSTFQRLIGELRESDGEDA